MENSAKTADLPAILGGRPTFAAGPPEWPVEDPSVAEVLVQIARDRSWGKYYGRHCKALCERLKDYHNCEHAVLCASGTAAVELALRGVNVGPGDEVILAAYDFKGNFRNVLTLGAVPVLIDISASSGNLNPELIEAAIGPKTKAILVSHLHGGVVPMPAVMTIAQAHSLPVIEDACQMPGARVYGKAAGAWGDVGVLSFGGSKLLTAGRGGALITNNAEVVQRGRLYSHRGNEAYPLSELQAAVLLPQLDRLDEQNQVRAACVATLRDALGSQTGLAMFESSAGDIAPAYYKLGFHYATEPFQGLSRDGFAAAMRAEGVAFDAGFRALHLTHSARRFRLAGELPNATAADGNVLTLHHPILLEPERIDGIAAAVERIRRNATAIRDAQIPGERPV